MMQKSLTLDDREGQYALL